MAKQAAARAGASTPDQSAWLEVTIRVPTADAERLGALLVARGSEGVITSTHELGRGTRRHVHETVRGFFPSANPIRARLAVEAALNDLHGARRRTAARAKTTRRQTPRAPLKAHWLALDERLWEMDWREHFQPIAVGKSLVIVPPWNRAAHADRRRIVIHPGMAFGTGQHATTHACLDAIEMLTDPPPPRALDVGTGTGVLAIALAKRGVRRVHAIDTDPQAVEAACDNVRRNRVGARVRVTGRALPLATANPVSRRSQYPLVVANLYIDVLVALAPTLAERVSPAGHLVTSGVLRTQQGRLRAAFGAAQWRVVRAQRRGSWVTTVFARLGAPRSPAPARARRGTRRDP